MFEDKEELERVVNFTVVIIYDISDNKRRNKIAKALKAYGYRVQKSAFECIIDNKKYKELLKIVDKISTSEDLVRVYKLPSNIDIRVWGDIGRLEDEDYIFF